MQMAQCADAEDGADVSPRACGRMQSFEFNQWKPSHFRLVARASRHPKALCSRQDSIEEALREDGEEYEAGPT